MTDNTITLELTPGELTTLIMLVCHRQIETERHDVSQQLGNVRKTLMEAHKHE